MMSVLLVVYYVIIAFLASKNVIAGFASVPTKNESSPIIVFNACSQDPLQCFISYAISSGDDQWCTSSLLHHSEKSYSPFPFFTNNSKIRLLKHIDVRDPGTVMITKKLLRDENNCFVVSGNCSTPKISNCLNASSVPAVNGTDRNLVIENNSRNEMYIVEMQFRYGADVISTQLIFPLDTKTQNFFDKSVAANMNISGPPIVSLFKKLEKDSKSFPIEEDIQLGSLDTCIHMSGSFEDPKLVYLPCETPRGRRPSTTTATTTTTTNTTTEGPRPVYIRNAMPDARK